MTPKELLTTCVDPALAILGSLTAIKVTDEARVLLMAIAGQESDWAARLQHGGPARSFWQFEQGGGVAGVMGSTPKQLQAVCKYLVISYDSATIFQAMAWNDTLATCMARLLLWTDAAPLPPVGDVQGAWNYYQRNWRPGAPHPEVWPSKYATARGLLT